MIEKLGIQDHFVFLRRLSQDEIVQAYKSADVFVLPSALEAFGLVVAEAMACGTPVVASNYGGIRCLVQDGVNGLTFRVKDSIELADRVKRILTDNALRIEIVENARLIVKQKFSIERTVDELEMLYKDLSFRG